MQTAVCGTWISSWAWTDQLLFSFSDVIAGRASLKEAAVRHPIVKNLRVLTAPASSKLESCVTKERVAAFLQNCRAHFTYTIVDCPAGLPDTISYFAAGGDRAVIVSTPDYTSLRGAEQAAQIFYREKMDNEAHCGQPGTPGDDRTGGYGEYRPGHGSCGLGLLGVVPEDRDIIACGNAGKVLMLYSEGPLSPPIRISPAA